MIAKYCHAACARQKRSLELDWARVATCVCAAGRFIIIFLIEIQLLFEYKFMAIRSHYTFAHCSRLNQCNSLVASLRILFFLNTEFKRKNKQMRYAALALAGAVEERKREREREKQLDESIFVQSAFGFFVSPRNLFS